MSPREVWEYQNRPYLIKTVHKQYPELLIKDCIGLVDDVLKEHPMSTTDELCDFLHIPRRPVYKRDES